MLQDSLVPQTSPPAAPSTVCSGRGHVSYVALAIAIVSLVLSVALPGTPGSPGATGATGPRGPAGPMGNGTIVVAGSFSTAPIHQNASSLCTHLGGLNLSINVPGPGTILVTATVEIWMNHTAGYYDAVNVFLQTSSGTYPQCGGGLAAVAVFKTSDEPSAFSVYNRYVLPMTATVVMNSKGTESFWFTGWMNVIPGNGTDAASVMHATLVLAYYPGETFAIQAEPRSPDPPAPSSGM